MAENNLTNAYVSPIYRNRDAGRKLLTAMVNFVQERKLELIIVWPSVGAVSFYVNCGFQIASEVHQDAGDFPLMELIF